MTDRIQTILSTSANPDWLAHLASCGLRPTVRCALACIQDSFNHLDGSTVIPNAAGIIQVISGWVKNNCDESAKSALDFIPMAESLADKAHSESQEQGDWWTFEAVETIGFLLVAIAQKHQFKERDSDFPDAPETLALHVCNYFLWFPGSVPRDKIETLESIRIQTLLPWLKQLQTM